MNRKYAGGVLLYLSNIEGSFVELQRILDTSGLYSGLMVITQNVMPTLLISYPYSQLRFKSVSL